MSGNIKVCDIDPVVKEKVEKFRLRKEKTIAAIVLKIDPDKHLVVIDEEHEDISIDDLREELPDHQPRYVVLSYVYKHDDGRVSFPFCFIFISPQGCNPKFHMMYSGTKNSLTTELKQTKDFELRSVEELTEEWLKEKLH
ncbi:hypothetical protein pdam_00015953 [Pocillopora damicornis]|uniref:ADF-H domain-containing protein n=1 Tax=Pocillopora damicornis TaxID=46731 RepID=A0A3M6TH53_POCDA|nr:glia maturation factor beta-like [Pocillopora damicornis]RMX40723.1 hypothetical protein pdam_00015953 [Pocillopora damicornis]